MKISDLLDIVESGLTVANAISGTVPSPPAQGVAAGTGTALLALRAIRGSTERLSVELPETFSEAEKLALKNHPVMTKTGDDYLNEARQRLGSPDAQ